MEISEIIDPLSEDEIEDLRKSGDEKELRIWVTVQKLISEKHEMFRQMQRIVESAAPDVDIKDLPQKHRTSGSPWSVL